MTVGEPTYRRVTRWRGEVRTLPVPRAPHLMIDVDPDGRVVGIESLTGPTTEADLLAVIRTLTVAASRTRARNTP